MKPNCPTHPFALAAALFVAACGGGLPARYVIEHDLSNYAFRRYQKSLDIELPVADNPALGHTAAYLKRATGGVSIVTALRLTRRSAC